MASNGRKDVSFCKGEFDTKGVSKFSELFEKEREVSKGEGDRSVVNNGSSVGLGAEEIIVGLLVVEEAKLRTFKEECVDLFEEL